jgi:hypothetical protein
MFPDKTTLTENTFSSSVADQYSLNPDPDSSVKPDPDPNPLMTKNFQIYSSKK